MLMQYKLGAILPVVLLGRFIMIYKDDLTVPGMASVFAVTEIDHQGKDHYSVNSPKLNNHVAIEKAIVGISVVAWLHDCARP